MVIRNIQLLVSILFFVGNKLLIYILKIFNKSFPGTITFLTYHSVKKEQRVKFKKHMEDILKYSHPVYANIDGPLPDNQHLIAVTFDDGYQSIIDNALPIMHDRKIPATVFITTGYLGQKPGWIRDPDHENASELVLTRNQLKQLAEESVLLGSHTVTHPLLANTHEDQVNIELLKSKESLEDMLNLKIDLFSFPFDSYTNKLIELSKKVGYKRAFIDIPIFPNTRIGEYLNGRIDVSLDDWTLEYRLKMLGAYQWLPFAVNLKGKLKLIFNKLYIRKI